MFVGRQHELSLIRRHLADESKAQLIVLYGRRRIGKSRLIAEAVSGEKQCLFFEGVEGQRTPAQVAQFLDDLSEQTGRVRLGARDWPEALRGLGEVVSTGRWVVVLDELPWLASGRTKLIAHLKLHWDRWAKQNKQLVMFLCGSVASFMSQHVVHSRALHNRKTLELELGPLTPKQAGEFARRRSARERAQLYMCLGGIPKYLEQYDAGGSVEKNLNRMCFTRGGFFIEEFETLFKEQFRSERVYEAVVSRLAQSGANVTELAQHAGVAKGGGFAGQLENLVRAQFIRAYRPLTPRGKRRSRTVEYRLVDPFLLFYFRFVHDNRRIIGRNTRENLYRAIVAEAADAYFGLAFERLCEDAFDSICDALDLSLSDIVAMGPHFQQKTQRTAGYQIDWLVMRRDGVWTVFEHKYSRHPVGVNVAAEVEQKITRLRPPETVSIERVLIAASGATKPLRALGYFDRILTLTDLVG